MWQRSYVTALLRVITMQQEDREVCHYPLSHFGTEHRHQNLDLLLYTILEALLLTQPQQVAFS